MLKEVIYLIIFSWGFILSIIIVGVLFIPTTILVILHVCNMKLLQRIKGKQNANIPR